MQDDSQKVTISSSTEKPTKRKDAVTQQWSKLFAQRAAELQEVGHGGGKEKKDITGKQKRTGAQTQPETAPSTREKTKTGRKGRKSKKPRRDPVSGTHLNFDLALLIQALRIALAILPCRLAIRS